MASGGGNPSDRRRSLEFSEPAAQLVQALTFQMGAVRLAHKVGVFLFHRARFQLCENARDLEPRTTLTGMLAIVSTVIAIAA